MPERAGFWRRAVAFVIDGLIVALALQSIALIAFPLSNARIQATSGIKQISCRKLTAPPAGIPIPLDFGANFATDCRFSILGFGTAHTLTVGRFTRDGNATKTISLTVLADDESLPIRGISLDLFLWPSFILLRLWSDGRSGSPGRRLCRIRLSKNSGSKDDPPANAALCIRYLVFALPSIPIWLQNVYSGLYPSFALLEGSFIILMIGSSALVGLAAIWAFIAIVQNRDAFYDVAAGTVVRCVLR